MYQRNSTDDFTGAIDWKPVAHTKITYEEQVDHYKADSYFTLAPSDFVAQEADGTPVALGNYDALLSSTALAPYTISACNATGSGASMGSAYTSATDLHHVFRPDDSGRLAHHQSGVRCDYELHTDSADADSLSDGDPAAAEHQHQEHLDERRLPLHGREQQPGQLLRELYRA